MKRRKTAPGRIWLPAGAMRPSPWTVGLAAAATAALAVAYAAAPEVCAATLASAVRQSTPLVLGALCGMVCERSGVINIGIEGQMLAAAFAAFWVSVTFSSLWAGVAAGALAGTACGLVLAVMTVWLRMDQIIAGVVLNILALGITGFYHRPGPALTAKLAAWLPGPLADIPLLGPALLGAPAITQAAVAAVFVAHVLFYFTVWGLRTRAVGEHPAAAASLGISVRRLRMVNVTAAGALAGLAGAFLSLEAVGAFERAMTNGRGFIALAVMIFGRWTPLGAWGAALVFGLASALQTQLQFWGFSALPHQFIGMLPYLLTVVVLALFTGGARAPSSLGVAYSRE
jgi:simple sugar transport system permease protein